ncbi:MAG: FAD-binding protein [Xanthomonadaceae bacterium]|nr:FAD-binding protein [Xanthomonadaceae bacterium]
MSRVLVVAEHADGRVNVSTARTLACAKALELETDVVVFADDGSAVAAEVAKLMGVKRVLRVDAPHNAHAIAAVLAPQLAAMAPEYSHLLAPATTFGRDLMPRVAALLGVPQVTDLMEVVDARTFKRPVFAGNVIMTVRVPDGIPVVATVRGASWPAVEAGDTEAPVEPFTVDADIPAHTRYEGLKGGTGAKLDLQSATRVVAGGRGVGSKENFALIEKFAERLGAAVGASRAAVDAGYVANDCQVGQTGKIIAPDLYVAIGISGAIQHLTGIKDARTIVAINKDGDAPIFEVADIGLVGDLFKVLPELEAALDAEK